MNLITNYFPQLSTLQKTQFEKLESLYREWNTKINVISRKDIDALYEKHVLHALGISKVQSFKSGSRILDVGTGGGFPGIPLAILYPKVDFFLIDAIGKKIKVVQAISDAIGLKNVQARHQRAQEFKQPVDFIVSRAVTKMEDFVPWVSKNIKNKGTHKLRNGILYLKGGDLSQELASFPQAQEFELSSFFSEEFFETKKVVYLPLK
ncbi:MAG: 16S rRNA (guanine(527)-N(7))-methyltransferase RsmG [Flavobacteriaceae bacterium]